MLETVSDEVGVASNPIVRQATKGRLGVNFEKAQTRQLSRARHGKGLLRTSVVVSMVPGCTGTEGDNCFCP